jgi:C-terminal processing protease CtpA/Prc
VERVGIVFFSQGHSYSRVLILSYFLSSVAADFVDAMDETNYVAVQLSKPMGIVFEENDSDIGGIYVQSLKEDGSAANCGFLKEGDQLIAVNTMKVSGLPFDDALGAIVDSEGDSTKLVLFRGSAKQFYGPTGANREWVGEFVARGGVSVSS